MSYNYCPHCGGSIEQAQLAGQMIHCKNCGQEIGSVPAAPTKAAADPVEERIRQGSAARCPVCQQAVEVKGQGGNLVPHYAAGQKKICPGSGKPAAVADPGRAGNASAGLAATPSPTPPAQLSKYYTRDLIRVLFCQKRSAPTIEELTLEYLDKADRVRIQIEALRDVLGPKFRMKDYPAPLNRPHLAVWGHAAACVIAKKHGRGGYESMADAEIGQAVGDVKNHEAMFFD